MSHRKKNITIKTTASKKKLPDFCEPIHKIMFIFLTH